MILITKADKIKNIVKRWTRQYPNSKQDVARKLRQANPTTEDEIVEIIGNRSWTDNRCQECSKDCDTLVQLGEDPDHESATANICLNCLHKAIDMANKA